MKKSLILVVLLLSGACIYAQNIRWGVTAGANFSNVTGDDVNDNDTRVGLNFGGLAQINVAQDFDVQPEIRYSMRGWKEGDFEIKIDYVDVPVMADYEVLDGLSIQGGPIFGFNVSKKAEFDGEELDSDEFFSDFNGFNFGAGLGAQYELNNGLFFQARYDMGFTDHFDNFNAKPCNVSLNVGYLFDNGGDVE